MTNHEEAISVYPGALLTLSVDAFALPRHRHDFKERREERKIRKETFMKMTPKERLAKLKAIKAEE